MLARVVAVLALAAPMANGAAAAQQCRLDSAAYLEKAAEIFARRGDGWGLAMTRIDLALTLVDQGQLEEAGETDWWTPPPWNKDKDRPSVLDVERLFRRHAGEIRQGLSDWLGDGGNSDEEVA